MTAARARTADGRGLLVAATIGALWATSLLALLATPLARLPWPLVPGAMAWQMLLFTGLFITAHDAMHGQVAPGHRRLNHAVGAIAVGLFALFSYRKVFANHWRHHRRPCSATDPDFHDGRRPGFVAWYVRFFAGYSSVWQIGGMAVVANVMMHGFHVADANLWLFWALPALASSVQLFYFGTYRPHREPSGGYMRPHCARSDRFPAWLSLVTCYHFGGYHEEHHLAPATPWWGLPAVRRGREGS